MNPVSTLESTENQTIKEIPREYLVAGDIIATRDHSVGSNGVRFFTGGQASHAILYTGVIMRSQSAVDAMPDRGVTEDRLHNKITQASYAVVFRHRTATAEQRARACQWAQLQAQLNKPYDFQSAARVGSQKFKFTSVGCLIVVADGVSARLNPEGEDASFMCSELVFRAFEIGGAPLTDKPAHHMSPGSLFRTERLDCLGRLV